MRKLFLILLVFLISISFVSAVRINEVEMNPQEGKYGKEWIELYNDDENDLDISGWEIWEGIVSGAVNPKKIQSILEGTIISKKGFYIIECQNKLNNNGDFVILYNAQKEEIDKTEILKESSSSSKTWQLCNSEWVFEESTKGKENLCLSKEETKTLNETENEENTSEMKNTTEINQTSQTQTQTAQTSTEKQNKDSKNYKSITLETITLTGKDIKSEKNKELNKSDYAIFGFIAFCILLGILFLIKNIKKSYKSEFD